MQYTPHYDGHVEGQINEMEREAILHALETCNWFQARAARKLGVTERMIGYKIKKNTGLKEKKSNRQSLVRDQYTTTNKKRRRKRT